MTHAIMNLFFSFKTCFGGELDKDEKCRLAVGFFSLSNIDILQSSYFTYYTKEENGG